MRRKEKVAPQSTFDPVEYLDVLIGFGYEPSAVRRRDGSLAYREMFPLGPRTQKQMAACNAAWTKLRAAPDGIDRVVAECLRRGLVE
jgi:hypothetical protein